MQSSLSFLPGPGPRGKPLLGNSSSFGVWKWGKSGLCPSSTLFEMGTLGESQEVVIEGGKEEKSKHKRAGLGFLSH